MNRVTFTEETVLTAAEAIRREMTRINASLPGTDFGLSIANRCVTVDGWVSCKAAEMYESYGDDYFTLRYHTGVMLFSRRVVYECEIASLTEALLRLFSCELLVLYILD